MKDECFVYILKCADGLYYTGCTKFLDERVEQHERGEGANYTKKRLPVTLVYTEEFDRIDHAFDREKQIQGWSREKKEALITRNLFQLHKLSACRNSTHFKSGSSRPSGAEASQMIHDPGSASGDSIMQKGV